MNRSKEGREGEHFSESTMFPRTNRLLKEKLSRIKEKLRSMYGEGVPWPHDAGGFHFDLRNLLEEERRVANLLFQVEVVSPPKNPSRVVIGSVVQVGLGHEQKTFMVGSQTDALYLQGEGDNWISDKSPIGKSLMGKETGQTFSFKTPNKEIITGKVLSIQEVEESDIL